ncbi:PAS domain S-box protein [Leptolyngbya sp. AN03gr2]|uniref:PAS domain-containing hybrid sensor histidine kinase/response regulator n=1 Tax=unclassified Leptolyngbya TaxID=2650499 RepID=UPI003D31C2FE
MLNNQTSGHDFSEQHNGQATETGSSALVSGDDRVGMVLQLADGSIQACNTVAEKFLGFTLAQMQGCHYIDCPWQTIRTDGSPFPGDSHPPMVALRTGQPVTGEVMGVYQPNGDLVWLKINAQPLFQQNNTVPWAVVTTFAPLSEIEMCDRFLSQGVPAILWINLPKGECSSANQWFYDYTGLPLGSAEGWGWTVALHPDDRDLVHQGWQRSTQQGQPFEMEYRLRRADGEYRWFLSRSSPVQDSSGRIHHWFGVAVDIHDFKCSQEDLQRREAIFRRLVEISMFGVAIGDFSGKMLYANDALLNLIGYSREELEAGQILWINLTPPEYLHLDLQAGEELRQHRVSTPFEKEYFHKDGHRVPILIGGALIDEPHTEQELIVCFYLDLSELKQTENSLQEALKRLNSHVENTPMAVIEWDANLIVRRWSGAVSQMFGWKAEEVLGTYISDLNLVYEDDTPIITEVSQRILSGTEPQIISQNRNYTKDGSILHCVWYNSTLTDATGQVASVLSLVMDITEQVQAEELLRQSEERFRLAARAVAGMVYDWNVQTGEVYRSEGVYELIGFPPEAVPQNSAWWGEKMHPEDYHQVEQHWAAIVSGQSNHYDVEYRIRHRAGHWVNVWDRGYLIRDRQGQVVRVVGSTTDITARKQIEQQREQLLRREQAAREQAELVSRMKDEFLAAISHELRTPLNPILGWTKMLQTHQFTPEKVSQALATIEHNARLQVQLIEDLLDISRIMQGKLSLNVTPVPLQSIIAAAIETVQLAADAKAIAIQTSLDPDVQPISGDAARLQQVMWNLLSNAIKFTPTGGRVEVGLSWVDADNANENATQPLWVSDDSPNTHDPAPMTQYAQIVVRDTGIGISPDFLPQVFEYFRQEDGATTRRFGGLGLGLAIVKRIVELHGGTIWAENAGMGQGATFTIQLPLRREWGDRAMRKWIDHHSTTLSPAQSLTGLQILVVDDDPDSRNYVAFLLELEQAIVTAVDSAAAALRILSQSQPDILLSDIGMPQIDGYELMQQIRYHLRISEKQLPAIALTAYAGELDHQQALAAGFQQHLTKPIEPEQLVNAIASLVGKQPDPLKPT